MGRGAALERIEAVGEQGHTQIIETPLRLEEHQTPETSRHPLREALEALIDISLAFATFAAAIMQKNPF